MKKDSRAGVGAVKMHAGLATQPHLYRWNREGKNAALPGTAFFLAYNEV
jgi:hypothetical protein